MFLRQFRWSLALLLVLALVIAACQPAATPTPTPRPTEPPTEVPVEEVDEEVDEEADEAETEEAGSGAVEVDATVEVEAVVVVEVTEIVEIASTEIVDIIETEVVEVVATEVVEVVETEIVEVVSTEIVEVMETEIVEVAATEIVEIIETEIVSAEATVIVEGVIEGEAVVQVLTETPTPLPVVTEVIEVTEVVIETTEVVVMTTATPLPETPEADEEIEATEMVEIVGVEIETTEVAGEAMATAAPMGDNLVVISAEEPVIIGLAAALSGEGVAPLGVDIQRGAQIAIARRGTVTVDGTTFDVALDSQDDLCSAEGGQAVANRFVSNPEVVAVVGAMCSSACRAAAPIFDAAGFTTISPSCTAADLTTSGSSSFNRVVVSDAFQGRIAADFIYTELGIERIATIHDGSPYGEGLVAVLTERFTELGGEVVASDAVNVGDTEFRGLLEDVAQRDPELIYFGGFPAEAARLIVQRADAGLDEAIFMGADGILGPEVVELSGADSEGVYASAAMPSVSEAFDDFLAEYVDTYGEEPPAPYHAHAFDGVNIILDAVEATAMVDDDGNLVIDREAIAEYVRSFQGYEGLSGSLGADGTGETSFTDIGISQVQDGAFVRLYVGRVVDGEVIIDEFTADAAAEDADAEAVEEDAETEEPEAEATEAS